MRREIVDPVRWLAQLTEQFEARYHRSGAGRFMIPDTKFAVPIPISRGNEDLYGFAHQLSRTIAEKLLGSLVGKADSAFVITDNRGVGRRIQDLADEISRQGNSFHWVFYQSTDSRL